VIEAAEAMNTDMPAEDALPPGTPVRLPRKTKERERKCIVTGEILPDEKLIRFAADPEGRVVPDVAAKLPGRGMWVSANREAVSKAAAKNIFSRAAQESLKADANLADLVESLLVAQIQGWIGLARRAGELVLGFDVIERTLRGGKPVLVLIEAQDAGEDGRRKLQEAADSQGLRPFVLGALTREELGLALGRGNVVHAALTPGQKSGSLAERLVSDAGRLAGFRPPTS
jgi:hypothetical protein